MESLDIEIIRIINQFAQQYPFFDRVFSTIGGHLFRTVTLVALVWWAWFRPSKTVDTDRERLISTLLFCMVAIIIAKLMSVCLPFRVRPLAIPGLVSRLPASATLAWEKMSSFPSDHAVLFFTLSTGLTFVSRPVGIFAYTFTILFVCLPRIYIGEHYPTDIIAGALVGIGVGWVANIRSVSSFMARLPVHLLRVKQGVFYALLFVMTFLIGTVGNDIRNLIEAFFHLLTRSK